MDLSVLRGDMVDGLTHASKGVLESSQVSAAMQTVPRHEFIDTDRPEIAYEDRSFTHHNTTILSPSMVAVLLEALQPEPEHAVLVVGVGTGYTTAVIAEIAGAKHVNSVDLSRPLVLEARRNLRKTGYNNVLVDCRDGANGLPEYAPFDRILVEAAAMNPPEQLLNQLSPAGRLVMPIGVQDQELQSIRSDGTRDAHRPVQFKPLLIKGEQVGGLERNRTHREDQERALRAAERRGGWEHDWIDWNQS